MPAQFRLRNDLYCVEWGVKLYSLTHSLTHYACTRIKNPISHFHAKPANNEYKGMPK